jgi:hypothetical protein
MLQYNETRSVPFLYDPESYYLSIVRFTLDTSTLPVFIPEIKIQGDPNLTVYSVTLSWTDPASKVKYNAQECLRFIPQDKTRPTPLPPLRTKNGFQDNSNGYYNVYNYQYVIFLVNNTLAATHATLKAKLPKGVTLPSDHPPIMTWNTDNNTAILNSDVLGYNTSSASYIGVYFNSNMAQLFSSFPSQIVSYSKAGDLGRNVKVITNSFGYGNVAPFPPSPPPGVTTYDAILTIQEYSTVSAWNPVMSVVFCSNTLPIVANAVSRPILFLNGNIVSIGGNNNQIQQIITDTACDGGVYKPSILYQPTGEYRLISLMGTQPLSTIDITVFWKDRFGLLNNFYLPAGSTATLKLLFTKRSARN